MSPYVFWELLAHVDDAARFSFFKTQLLKLGVARFFDDPRAEYELELGLLNPSFPAKLPDPIFVQTILSILEDAKSLEEFYAAQFDGPDKVLRSVNDCAVRVRGALAEQ